MAGEEIVWEHPLNRTTPKTHTEEGHDSAELAKRVAFITLVVFYTLALLLVGHVGLFFLITLFL